uniref:Ephrin B2 n=1 Tax=Paramormyrops kingsleyae TaxID=1676925 RepID=A0A3B3RT37_9TELE
MKAIMGDAMWRYYFGVMVFVCKVNLPSAAILESIYWNTTNTKFVPGQGLVLYPQIGDKMDIVCPRGEGGQTDGVELYKLYMVERKQLEACAVTEADTPLLNCDKPDQDVKFTLKFQEFSPNLWGLEFFRGKDYHIISTSNGTLEGLNNQKGGVCKTKFMKITMKVGQSEYSLLAQITASLPVAADSVCVGNIAYYHRNVIGSEVALFAGIISGSVIFVAVIVMLVLLLLKYRRRHRKHSPQHAAALSLSTLASPKRGGGGGNNNGSEPSDIIIPLRTADSVFCPHYEKVSGDYGHPVYIVQEMPPQSPANIYYKV